jgi:hypothetical protein
MLQRPRRRCEGTAMGAIVLDLRPGLGIGPFSLGNFPFPVIPFSSSIISPIQLLFSSLLISNRIIIPISFHFIEFDFNF